MKRDMDLVRDILIAVEQDGPSSHGIILRIEGRTPQDISEHVRLLGEANLLDAVHDGSGMYAPTRLTWEGHEFIDAARNDTF